MKPLIIQFSGSSCYYRYKHFVLKHPQSVSFRQGEISGVSTDSQNYFPAVFSLYMGPSVATSFFPEQILVQKYLLNSATKDILVM
jgi:hypothetical protein